MQILESSRPIRKCEHLPRRILHFQADISAQKQALGNISEFTAYVRVCVRVCVETSVCACVRVCTLSVFMRSVREGFNCGFSLLFSICFFLAHWSNVCYYY